MRDGDVLDHAHPVSRPPVWRRRQRWRRLAGLVLSLTAAGLIAAVAGATSHAADPRSGEVVVVQPGDTLWSIAARHLPSRDPYAMIDAIQRRNGLVDLTIYPGQELVLP